MRTAAKRLCEKDPNLWGVDLSVILPVSGNRRLSPFSFNASSLSQRDRGNAFKFGISLSRDSAMRNPKLNGSGH